MIRYSSYRYIRKSPVTASTMGYFDFFVSNANDGYVFDTDMSSLATVTDRLTAQERKERRDWNKTFATIETHYFGEQMTPPKVTSKEGVLQQRLIAPRMEPTNVTRRSGMTEAIEGRMYPHRTHLAVWHDAESNIANYSLSEAPIKGKFPQNFLVFQHMINLGSQRGYRSEERELEYLLNGLNFLTTANIVGEIQKETGAIGKPDFTLKGRQSSLGIIVEGKSTHNLLIPDSAATFVDKYRTAYADVIEQSVERTIEWGHIAHPLAQLLGYLVDNNHRYGALTSATRTVFVHISGSGASIKVNVSEPYYIGEENYLRAWAYVFSQGCKQKDKFKTPQGKNKWIKTGKKSPTPQPSPAEKSSGGKRTRKRKAKTKQEIPGTSKNRRAVPLSTLSTVDFQDLTIGKELGIGRNGSLFQVSWKGKEYALKQFDIRKDGLKRFENEIAAYLRLEKVWGKLVPRPYFISEAPSGGVKLLGLQLGSSIDDSLVDRSAMWEQWQQAHAVLEQNYGIRHNDAENGRNTIFIDDGTGSHRQLAIVDFESWDDLLA